MEAKAVIIPGEASESDEESVNTKTRIPFPLFLTSNSCGTMIQGEAKESDDENDDEGNASYMVDAHTCSYTDVKVQKSEKSYVKYNSLLHKKLRECNKSLDRDIQELFDNTILNAVEGLTDTNKQLLKSELILQETVSKFQTASIQISDTLNSLQRIVEEDFFKSVKI
jgi:hypothetical protein